MLASPSKRGKHFLAGSLQAIRYESDRNSIEPLIQHFRHLKAWSCLVLAAKFLHTQFSHLAMSNDPLLTIPSKMVAIMRLDIFCNLAKFDLLSPEQRRCVRACLIHMLDDPEYKFHHEDIQTALDSYWSEL